MTEKIKLTDEQVAHIQQFWMTLDRIGDDMQDLSRKMAICKAQGNLAKMLFWEELEKMYPDIRGGEWRIDTGEWELINTSESGEKSKDPSFRDFLDRLIEGLNN